MSDQKNKNKIIQDSSEEKSLGEVNSSIAIPRTDSFLRKLLAFSGPGALIAVGYMDPGNWITSIVGGSQYQYLLLSVILMSSLVAMMLQYMAGKLGIVTQKDLAQNMRQYTNKFFGFVLWVITELAIMATDMAEVIGSAIALHLLFGFSLIQGVVLTILDVFLLLLLMRLGFRKIEAIVATLILTILFIFIFLVIKSNPNIPQLLNGFLPTPQTVSTTSPGEGIDSPLTMALGIVGATVMPHNLFLHSSISQTRKVDHSSKKAIKEAVRFMTWDSNIQLSLAFVVNSMLLVLGAALFFGKNADVSAFGDLYAALNNKEIVGSIASPILSTLFAVALLASGQNSTITGTITGQTIMEGFIHVRIPQWLRRLVTRAIALLPILFFAIKYEGSEGKLDQLLVYTQVFLSVALPFSMIPLIYLTSSKKIMGKEFANNRLLAVIAWICAIVLTLLNIRVIIETFS